MNHEGMQAAIKDLQDAMVVMAYVEKRQSEILKAHTEHLGQIEEFRRRTESEIAEFRSRTEQNLAEITDKLNGLIGYIAGQRPQGPKQ